MVPDAVPDAEIPAEDNPDVKAFQEVMEKSRVAIEMIGKKIKPRKQKAKQLAS